MSRAALGVVALLAASDTFRAPSTSRVAAKPKFVAVNTTTAGKPLRINLTQAGKQLVRGASSTLHKAPHKFAQYWFGRWISTFTGKLMSERQRQAVVNASNLLSNSSLMTVSRKLLGNPMLKISRMLWSLILSCRLSDDDVALCQQSASGKQALAEAEMERVTINQAQVLQAIRNLPWICYNWVSAHFVANAKGGIVQTGRSALRTTVKTVLGVGALQVACAVVFGLNVMRASERVQTLQDAAAAARAKLRAAQQLVLNSVMQSHLSTIFVVPVVEEIICRHLVYQTLGRFPLGRPRSTRLASSVMFALLHLVPVPGSTPEWQARLASWANGAAIQTQPYEVAAWNFVRLAVLFTDSFSDTCPLYEEEGLFAVIGEHAMWNALTRLPAAQELHVRGLNVAKRAAEAKTMSMALKTAADLAVVHVLLKAVCGWVAGQLER